MKTPACVSIATTILLTAAVWSQDAADERELLQGTWLPTAAELSEKPFDEATLTSMKLVIEARPTEFKTRKGELLFLATYKRAKTS